MSSVQASIYQDFSDVFTLLHKSPLHLEALWVFFFCHALCLCLDFSFRLFLARSSLSYSGDSLHFTGLCTTLKRLGQKSGDLLCLASLVIMWMLQCEMEQRNPNSGAWKLLKWVDMLVNNNSQSQTLYHLICFWVCLCVNAFGSSGNLHISTKCVQHFEILVRLFFFFRTITGIPSLFTNQTSSSQL